MLPAGELLLEDDGMPPEELLEDPEELDEGKDEFDELHGGDDGWLDELDCGGIDD